MKRTLFAFFIVLFLTNGSYSQAWKAAKVEVFGGVAAFQYFGDIGGAAGDVKLLGLMDINLLRTRPGITAGARYQISRPVQLKAVFTTGLITQSDEGSKNSIRNYAFSTIINELAIMGEYYLIPESEENYFYNIMQVRGGIKQFRQPISVYLTFGFGGLLYSVTPKGYLANPPPGEVSKFDPGSGIATFIPIGGGVKYAFIPKMSIGIEIIGRLTSTNTLDGYDSPYANYNDFYHSIHIKFNYKLHSTKKTGAPPRRRSFR